MSIEFKDGAKLSFIGVAETKEDQLTLVAVFPTGPRLFLIKTDGAVVQQFEAHPSLPCRMRPEHILGEYQVILWPREHLLRGGLALLDDGNHRTVFRNKTPVIEIDYETPSTPHEGRIVSRNIRRGYTLTIEPIP